MADSFTLSRCYQYMIVKLNDPIDLANIKLLITKIDSIGRELGIDKVLVDASERAGPMPSTEELLDIGMFLVNLTKGRIKFAAVVNFRPEVHGFFEAAVGYRGIDISFFEQEASALTWLGVGSKNY